MRSFQMLCVLLHVAFSTAASTPTSKKVPYGQTPTLITFPTQPTDTGLKQIPDAAHPFIAPGPNDQRGPCPGMNTLANHGYIPRNGIATFEEITLSMVEAYNLEINFGAFLAAANMLLRGNPFVNKISIGGVSPLVPPLPGNIGSNVTGGLAKHGGFEGTTKQASISTIGSFLRNQSFPQNWHRAAAPVTGEILSDTSSQLSAAIPIFAGHNDAQGNFVPDTPPPAPFDANPGCGFYYDLFANMPGGLANTTGIFKQNVDFSSSIVSAAVSGPPCDQPLLPFGPPDN
ncbi:hypothetical protein DFH09DRAFT_1428771 [Mycena vulgaris]|nr:hypothetical protein DFH09DRAFT_1428771 [Mycena vulgaris]